MLNARCLGSWLFAGFLFSVPTFAWAEQDPDIIWTMTYDGGNDDTAWDVAVDLSGNVYVTGESFGTRWDSRTIKYDSDGHVVWNIKYDSVGDEKGCSVAVDPRGNVYVAGNTTNCANPNDFRIIKYDAGGTMLWNVTYDSGGSDDNIHIAVDASGSVYIGGSVVPPASTRNYSIIKYDTDGHIVWDKQYDSGQDEAVTRIAVDASGSVYVTGTSGWAFAWNYRTIKYDAGGNIVWNKMYDGGFDEAACGIAVDSSGSVYVAGESEMGGGINDFRLIKYDPAGNIVWNKTFDGGSNLQDGGYGCTMDASGSIYVTGFSQEIGGNYDIRTLKYDNGGNLLWTLTFDGGGDDYGTSVAITPSGSIYIVGVSKGANWNYRTIAYGVAPANIVAQAAILPVSLCGSESAVAVLTVRNTGHAVVNGVTISSFSMGGTGSAVLLSGPYPSTPVVILANGLVVFTFTYTGSVPGVVRFTATVAGTDAVSGGPVSAVADGNSGIVEIESAKLEASALVLPLPLCRRGNLLASMTVVNTGQCPASGVTVQAMSLSGTGAAHLLSGPYPSDPIGLASGASVEFTFTYTGLSTGMVRFTATAAGADAGIGVGLAAVASDISVLSQLAVPRLEALVSLENPVVIVGKTSRIYLTVSNTGCGVATDIAPVVSLAAGASLVSLSGIEPAGLVSIPVGSSRTFTWTCSSLAEGKAVFSARVTGVDQETSEALSAVATAEMKVSKIAPVSMMRNKLKPGKILVAPNNIKRGDEKAGVFMKGDPNGMVEIGFYSEIGHLAGTRYVKLDANGEGVLEVSRAELTAMGLGSGLCWVRAAGCGVKDKSPLIISPKGQ